MYAPKLDDFLQISYVSFQAFARTKLV